MLGLDSINCFDSISVIFGSNFIYYFEFQRPDLGKRLTCRYHTVACKTSQLKDKKKGHLSLRDLSPASQVSIGAISRSSNTHEYFRT